MLSSDSLNTPVDWLHQYHNQSSLKQIEVEKRKEKKWITIKKKCNNKCLQRSLLQKLYNLYEKSTALIKSSRRAEPRTKETARNEIEINLKKSIYHFRKKNEKHKSPLISSNRRQNCTKYTHNYLLTYILMTMLPFLTSRKRKNLCCIEWWCARCNWPKPLRSIWPIVEAL